MNGHVSPLSETYADPRMVRLLFGPCFNERCLKPVPGSKPVGASTHPIQHYYPGEGESKYETSFILNFEYLKGADIKRNSCLILVNGVLFQ
jgi:hypothetical protein